MQQWVTYQGKKYPATETTKELTYVAGLWKRNAQGKLRRSKSNASGRLKKSMKPVLGMDGNQPFVDITPQAPYWQFIDLGVRGSKASPFKRQRESPFRFRNKRPPIKAILRWMKVKGIRSRDAQGRFIKQESGAFLIQRAIWRRGIRPTFFISDTGDRIQKKYAEKVAEAYIRDLDNAMTAHFKNRNKQ